MRISRRIISLFLALVTAVGAVLGCSVSAGATSKFDLISELKKYKITAKTKLDSSLYGYYKPISDHYVLYISGLDALTAAQIEETSSSDGYELSVAVVLDNGLGFAYEETKQIVRMSNGTNVYDGIRKVSFTHAGDVYKLMLEVENSDVVYQSLKTAKAAAVSIRALNTSSQIKTYYGDKSVYYIPFSADDRGTTDISKLEFSGLTSRVFSGKEVTPEITVKDGTYTLREGRDYSLTYKNNKGIGTATVIVTGKGSYTGTKKMKFKILPKPTELLNFSLSREKLTVNWVPVDGIDKYYIYKSDDKGVTYTLIGTTDPDTTSFVTKFPAGSRCVFRVRSSKTVNDKIYYSPYCRAVMVH